MHFVSLVPDVLRYIDSKVDSVSHFCLILTCRQINMTLIKRKPANITRSAAALGYLNVLKMMHGRQWLIDNHDPHLRYYMRLSIPSISPKYVSTIVYAAAEHDHVHIIRWLDDMNHKIPFNIIYSAAKSGGIDVIAWTHRNMKGHYPKEFYARVAEQGYISVFEWLYSKHLHGDHTTTYAAVSSGQLDTLKYLLSKNYPIHIDPCIIRAIQTGNIKMFTYLYGLQYVIDVDPWEVAILNHSRKMLDYLHENRDKFPWKDTYLQLPNNLEYWPRCHGYIV